jgi:hypothetical protein
MSDPFWTLWATARRPYPNAAVAEYLRLEFPAGDGDWLFADPAPRGKTTRPDPGAGRGACPRPVTRADA